MLRICMAYREGTLGDDAVIMPEGRVALGERSVVMICWAKKGRGKVCSPAPPFRLYSRLYRESCLSSTDFVGNLQLIGASGRTF
jgi:hypothetical protein